MKHVVIPPLAGSPISLGSPGSPIPDGSSQPGVRVWIGLAVAMGVLGAAVVAGPGLLASSADQAALPPPPPVAVSPPLQRDVEATLQFLGQLSAVENVELRAQVGGTLTEIHFKDGDIVHKGDLLFTIDPRPYEIRLAQANGQLESATARLELADRELARAQILQRRQVDTVENLDQRAADQRAAQGAVDDAKAQIQDAQFDLDHCRITAPFTGRIGTHLVTVGNLISGSRAATSPTTLLATIVWLDPVYLDFDMSEADYLQFSRDRLRQRGSLADKVKIALSDEKEFARQGTLDFVDNVVDRSSGTIHARATVPNPELLLTPGEFARLSLALGTPTPTLLVPDSDVISDQSEYLVMTVSKDGTVVPKRVQIGDMRGGLRVIRSGLIPDDRVIIEGLLYATPGSKVDAQDGAIQYAAAG